MYESFFNLAMKPFDLLPNPQFLFLSQSHRRAVAYLDYAVREGAGFVLLTGEIGSGKTTIMRDLIEKHKEGVVFSRIFNTKVNFDQLICMINEDFGLPVDGKDKISLLRDLNDFLIDQFGKGNRVALVVDEAQNLTPETLEEVRMLSNLETDKAKLLQIILVGQPELRTTLASPSMVQLRQRISVHCHITPLTRVETKQYILHRLDKAGNRNAACFSEDALDVIFKYSKGTPRLINIICDFLLLSAFAEERHTINADMVNDIVGDFNFDQHFWGNGPNGDATFEEEGAEPAAASPRAGEFSSIISDINQCLDELRKESGILRQALFHEMTPKVCSVEESLKSYREETVKLVLELRKDRAERAEKSEVPCYPENDSSKEGFFRRVLGGLGLR